MKLTRDLIEAGRTPAGGFTLRQLHILRIPCPQPNGWPAKGWIDRASGQEVTEGEYAQFLHLGGMTRQEQRQERKHEKKEAKLKAQPTLFKL